MSDKLAQHLFGERLSQFMEKRHALHSEVKAASEELDKLYDDEVGAAILAFNEKHAERFEIRDRLRAALTELEAELRAVAVTAFKETGAKTFDNGVGVRESFILQYEENDAYQYALAHSMFLKLDSKALDTYLKTKITEDIKKTVAESGSAGLPLEKWVTVNRKLTATLPKIEG